MLTHTRWRLKRTSIHQGEDYKCVRFALGDSSRRIGIGIVASRVITAGGASNQAAPWSSSGALSSWKLAPVGVKLEALVKRRTVSLPVDTAEVLLR